MRERVERRARALSLQPLRWPAPFPFDSDFAMLVATFAKRIGKTVAFALAAFRQAYAGGHALDVRDHVLIAAAACEMHPTRSCEASETRGLREELRASERRSARLGVERRAGGACRRAGAGRRAARSRRPARCSRRRAGEGGQRLPAARAPRRPTARRWLADPSRVDHVEIVDVASGEVSCSGTAARARPRALRGRCAPTSLGASRVSFSPAGAGQRRSSIAALSGRRGRCTTKRRTGA